MTAIAEWQETTIGALASISRGASPRPIASSRWFDSGSAVRWVRIADVNRSNGRTLLTTTQALSPDGIARSRYLDPGTLIMSIAATVGIPVITGVPTCIHDGFVALENLKVDQRFLLYLLKASEGKLRESGQSGSQMNVNTDIVKGLRVCIPVDLKEQGRIAAALWNADDLIATLERLIAKKQAIKQGMMQQLLTGRTRLPKFRTRVASTPRVAPLVSVTSWISGGTPNRTVTSYWGGQIPWISAATLKQSKIFDSDRHLTPEGVRCGSRMAPTGAVLVLVRGMALHNETRIGLVTRPVSFNQDVKALIPVNGILPEFLLYALQARGSEILDLVSSAGSGTGVLDTRLLQLLPIWFPDEVEQRAVAKVLADIESEIDLLQQRLTKAEAIKTGMMQQLLTGRTRLLVEEGAA